MSDNISALPPFSPKLTTVKRIAVVGAGWAGIAAAVSAIQAGHEVHLYEAARRLGGRARSITLATTTDTPHLLDNGQHILIGAYQQSLDLMRAIGVDPETVLFRTPLDLRDAKGNGLHLPALPAPLDGVVGVLRAQGWTLREQLALVRQLFAWKKQQFRVPSPTTTVQQLCQQLPAKIVQELIEPLCVAGMNTPMQVASAEVFLRMLQDSLMGRKGSSDLLLPRVPLGALLAEPAIEWLESHAAKVHLGVRVAKITAPKSDHNTDWWIEDTNFDAIILATHSAEAIRLIEGLASETASLTAPAWLDAVTRMQHKSIASIYVQVTCSAEQKTLERPMLMLHSTPAAPAQFVFDRGQLNGPAGLLAFVVSASEGSRQEMEVRVLQQASTLLGHSSITPLGTVVEKRATFACTAGLVRPSSQPFKELPTLQVCGDYIAGPYPGTLEGAVLSGMHAFQKIGLN